MKPLYLKFRDKIEAENYLLDIGFSQDENGAFHHNEILLDVVGIINGDFVLGEDGSIISQDPDIPGWHVNLLVPDELVIMMNDSVVNVKTPARKWAGY